MRLHLIVNTRSSAIGSGFGWLWQNPTEGVLQVAAVAISRQFGQCSKQPPQRSVNLSISMSMGAVPLAIQTQIDREMTIAILLKYPAANLAARHQQEDRPMVKIDATVKIALAYHHHVRENKCHADITTSPLLPVASRSVRLVRSRRAGNHDNSTFPARSGRYRAGDGKSGVKH